MRSRPRLQVRLAIALAFVLAVTLALAGCRKPRQRAFTKDQERTISAALLTTPPTPQIPIDAIFDGKVRLIGVDLDKREVRPGDAFTVTWYWEALAEAPGDWKIFVHFEGPGKRSTHDHGPVGELLPIGSWKAGQIIKDVQTISVMQDFPEGPARLHAGIFDEKAWTERQQNVRMQLTNGADIKVPKDGDQRVEAAVLTVTKSAAKGKSGATDRRPDRRPRRYTAYKAATPLVIDGRLDDAGWQGVPLTSPFVKPDGGDALGDDQETEARLTWDDTFLYVAFTTKDNDIRSDYTGRDAKLWEADVVEIYLDPGADGKDYLELQVAPTGEIFDALFTSRREPRWEDAAPAFTMSGLVAKVVAEGTVNVADRDTAWTVEVAIPWAEVPGGLPSKGTALSVNLYRLDQRFHAAWAPVGNDYHNLPEFGRVILSQSPPPGGAPPPAPTPEGTPAPTPEGTPTPAPAPAPGTP